MSLRVRKKRKKGEKDFKKKENDKIQVTLNLSAIKIRMYISQGILHGYIIFILHHIT